MNASPLSISVVRVLQFMISGILSAAPRINSQRGVYLPIFAVIILAILTVVIGLGVDTSYVRARTERLRLRAEDICKASTQTPTLTADMVRAFREELNGAIQNGSFTDIVLTGARITIPTMPRNGDFRFPPSNVSTPQINGVAGTQFSNLQHFIVLGETIRCDLLDGDPGSGALGPDCIFQGDVAGDPNYPTTLMGNVLNAGNTVACELQGTVESFFSGTRSISTRTVWSRPVRGVFPNYDPLQQIDVRTAPGIAIGVATQLTTDAQDPRFRFHRNDLPHVPNSGIEVNYDSAEMNSNDPETGLTVPFRQRYDPLYRFNTTNNFPIPPQPLAPGRSGFSYNLNDGRMFPSDAAPGTPDLDFMFSPAATGGVAGGGLLSDRQSAQLERVGATPYTYFWNTATGVARNTQMNGADPATDPFYYETAGLTNLSGCDDPSAPAGNCLVVSDREEMLAACMNPLVLVRNLFVSTIVELAARHGQLRRMTEFSVINPQHRNAPDGASLSPNFNHPVVLSHFGEDILERRYQPPFVTFFTGSQAAPPPVEFGNHRRGFTYPFLNNHPFADGLDPTDDDELAMYHSLLASQLRICYHLYQQSERGVDRYEDKVVFKEDSLFHPPQYSYAANIPEPYIGDNTGWDQRCPWRDLSCAVATPPGSTLGEVASILGSIQICPFRWGGLSTEAGPFPDDPYGQPGHPYDGTALGDTPANETGICAKPPPRLSASVGGPHPDSDSTYDLRPDIVGYLRYLAGQAPAIKRPGLFPINDAVNPPGNPDLNSPFDNNEYTGNNDPFNPDAAILIVTHQPLSQNEVAVITALTQKGDPDATPPVAAGPLGDRPITVAYFPSNASDSQMSEIIKYVQAFNVTLNEGNILLDGTPSDLVNENRLYVFSPLLEKYVKEEVFPVEDLGFEKFPQQIIFVDPNDPDAFREYWVYLLTDDDEGIEMAARNIFDERLSKLAIKY